MIQAREERGFKQRNAAMKIGSSQQNLSGYEAGSLEPPAGVLLALSNTYNVSTDCLLKDKVPVPRGYLPPPLKVETVKKYSRRVHDAIGQGMYVPVRLLKDSASAGSPAQVDENHANVEDDELGLC